MNDDSLSGLSIILILVAVHALLVAAHAALTNAQLRAIREMALEGNRRAKQTVDLVGSSHFIITYQLLRLSVQFAIAAVTVLLVAEPMRNGATGVEGLAINAVWLVGIGALTLILGDLVPEAVGSTYATSLTFPAANLMRLLMTIAAPLVIVILEISQLLSRLFGSGDLVNTITEEEIMSMIDAGHSGGSIEDEEKNMIYSVLQLDQTRVSEVMVPRIDIVAVELDDSIEDAGAKFVETGFSRIPVYEEHIDNIKGLLYAKDLLAHWSRGGDPNKSITDMMRPAYFVPETKGADELLKEIQTQKVHIAIVVDEYGGTAGLVTIENIIEEIIGDIQDEYDLNEEAEYVELGPDEYIVDSSIDLDDLNDMLDLELPTEDSDTLGGYIYTHFGRVPLIGETIDDDKMTITVQSVDGRRIRKVHVIRKRINEDELDDSTDPNITIVETHDKESAHDGG